MYRPQRASPPPSQSSPIPAFNLDDDNFEPLWASASQPFQPYSEGPSQPVEDDSPVEEVEPVKPKRKYTRRSKPTKKNDKEFVEPWTIKEEIALCKAWVAKSEDSVEGNGKKGQGFRQKPSEMEKATLAVNLNDEAADSEDVEAQEVPAPMGRDRAKKKGSSSGARSKNFNAKRELELKDGKRQGKERIGEDEGGFDKSGRPRIKGTSLSSGISKMIKSIVKINLPILTSMFLAIPLACLMVRLASSMVNLVTLTTVNPGRGLEGCPILDKSKKNKALKKDEQGAVGVMDDTSGRVPKLIRICCNVGSSKSLVPPFGSPERPRPDVTPRIAESFKSRPCHPELIRMYGYQNEEDEDEVMTTKDDDLLFYQDTFPVDKFVPYGKAMGSKRIEKSPTIPVAVLGLCNTLTWVKIKKKLRKKPPMKH
ncbi:hypothetical protein Tco_1404130 [Tanacetum coccineum]